MTNVLRQTYAELLNKFTDNQYLIDEFWTEIELNYSKPNRYYHTLEHLSNLLAQLIEVQEGLKNWDTILFTLFYHDAIYNSSQSDNEEKSASLAEKRMLELSVPLNIIEKCKAQILATKSHTKSLDSDTNYFTDVDLSVLGLEWEIYYQYYNNIRKEYSIFPDSIYNSGRQKVLTHFLEMDRIYKTDFFHSKFEKQARQNLFKEKELLKVSG